MRDIGYLGPIGGGVGWAERGGVRRRSFFHARQLRGVWRGKKEKKRPEKVLPEYRLLKRI